MDENTELYIEKGLDGLFSSTTDRPSVSTTEGPGQATPPSTNCSLLSPFDSGDYNGVTATICALYLFFGVFCCLLGYRCFKAVMFLTGFVFASVIVYLICMEEDILDMWANTLIAVGAGLLFGLITLLVQYVGLFMLGFHGGLLLGVAGLVVADVSKEALHDHSIISSVPHHSPWVSLGILLSCGLVVSLLNLYFQRYLTMFCSALYGSAVVATCLDFFVENSVMLSWVWRKVRVKQDLDGTQNYCWFSWVILSSWPAMLLLGLVTQRVVAADGTFHDQPFSRSGRRSKPETREERKQRKYRYLYQVRTCHGDVISQPLSEKYVHQVDDPAA